LVARSNELDFGVMNPSTSNMAATHDSVLKKRDDYAPAMTDQIHRASGRNFGQDYRAIGNLGQAEINVPL